MSAPADDEIEISVFGPGFGECVVAHVGSGNWIIVDSCYDFKAKSAAALSYLASINVDPGKAVKTVLITHWHDDHIRGISQIVEACHEAKIFVPSAMKTEEFLEAIFAYEDASGVGITSGVSEIQAVFSSDNFQKNPGIASENKSLLHISGAEIAHGCTVELRALSPSDAQSIAMLSRIASLLPEFNSFETKRRAPRSGSNDLSVAAWLSIGDLAMLLGADLEIHAKQNCGWSAVRSIKGLPVGKADFFKVPHHGSQNGHDELVWSSMLHPNPISVLTPWNLGRGSLPTSEDIGRLSMASSELFLTSAGSLTKSKRYNPVVEKALREEGKRLMSFAGVTGHVRARRKISSSWQVELLGPAIKFAA